MSQPSDEDPVAPLPEEEIRYTYPANAEGTHPEEKDDALRGMSLHNILRVGAALAFVTFVLVLVLEIQIARRNASLDNIENATEELQDSVVEMNVLLIETRHIAESFNRTPEEQAASDEALQKVFQQIAAIYAEIVATDPTDQSTPGG